MASTLRSEYIGFTVNDTYRIYKILVSRPDGESREFEIAIANRRFLTNQVRYQDAAEICFLKVERELRRCGDDSIPASRIHVTEAELDEYREAHTKKVPGRAYRQKSGTFTVD